MAYAGIGGGGVNKITAGTNVTISPTSGLGNVTVNASASGSGETNTFGADGSSKTLVSEVQFSSSMYFSVAGSSIVGSNLSISTPGAGSPQWNLSNAGIRESSVTITSYLSLSAGATIQNILPQTVAATTITAGQYTNCQNYYCVVASTFPNGGGINAVTFAVDLTTGPWELDFNLATVTATTGTINLSFNGVNGGASSYNWSEIDEESQAQFHGTPDTKCGIGLRGNSITHFTPQNESFSFKGKMAVNPLKVNEITMHWEATIYDNSHGYGTQYDGSCSYLDATASNHVTSVRLEYDKNTVFGVGDATLSRRGR